MSLSVSPVRLSFGNTAAPQLNPDDLLSRQGAFTKTAEEAQSPAEPQYSEPKNHTALKAVLGTIAGAAIVAFGLYAAHKWGSNTFDAAKNFSDFKEETFFKKAKGYVTTAIGKAGKWIGDKCESAWKGIKGIFGKNTDSKETKDAAETVSEAAETAAETTAEAAEKA